MLNSKTKNLQYAEKLINKNLVDSALFYLNAILKKKIDQRDALYLRARVYNNKKMYTKALSDYNALIDIDPNRKEYLYTRGILRYQLGYFALALEDLSAANKADNTPTQSAFFKLEPSSGRASGISTLSTMEADIWNNIGLCYYQLESHSQAIEAFNSGISIDKEYLDLYVNRALAYEANGNIDKAQTDYKHVLTKSPNHTIASFNLMRLENSSNSKFNFLDSLDAFIINNPTIAEGYVSRGLYYYEIQHYELALKDFDQAARLQQENTDFKLNLALAHDKLNNTEKAEELLLEIVDDDPSNAVAYFNLGNIKFKRNSYDDAIAYYTLAHHMNPKNTSVLYNRGLSFYMSGRLDQACADMNNVKKMDEIMALKFLNKYCNKNE